MADYHASQAVEGNSPPSSLGNQAVASQSASGNQADLQANGSMPNDGSVIGPQPGVAHNQAAVVEPQADVHIHPDIPPPTEDVRAAIIALATSNLPVEVQAVDVEVVEAIIAVVARLFHAENGQCRHLDEVTGEQCTARKWKVGARKCMSHLRNRPSVAKQVEILFRTLQGHGTCSGNYAWKETDDGTLCDDCAEKNALRRERAQM
ncbi:hypothetical protein B0H65DRAFT_566020 [Neurospora tetraspora]|uniref:Uncharacterized protein n=1 Tax=Neurospora tetraspora TaxID=94610 RepID=A0AAE0J0I8_9PEZI|nr:hypothetical protein B0H65DRAFT_566020 [Neurospora tetraspora]